VSDLVEVLGKLILLAVIGAFLAHQLWSRKAHQRQNAEVCTRCGKEPVNQLSPELGGQGTMCAECQRVTQRNYRAGSLFFYSLAILFGLVFAIKVVPEIVSGIDRTAAEVIAIFISVIGLCAGAGFCIRYFGKKIV